MEKRGLGECLKAVGLKAGQGIVWGDEMRLGLWNTVRKAWVPRGVAVTRTTQISRTCTYVAVALNPLTGQLWWAWQANMKSEEMARISFDEGSCKMETDMDRQTVDALRGDISNAG